MAQTWIETEAPPWLAALGPVVERLGCTGVVLAAPITPAIAPAGRPVAAAALAALAEAAMFLACAGQAKALRPFAPVTLDVQYLRAGSGTTFSAAATVMRAGRSLVFTRAVLTAEPSGKELATATATWSVPA